MSTAAVTPDIQGLPAGATLKPIQGLPPGAEVRPLSQPQTTVQPGLFQTMKNNFNTVTQGAEHVPGESNLTRLKTDVQNFGAGGGDLIRAAAHPIRTGSAMIGQAKDDMSHGIDPMLGTVVHTAQAFRDNPARAAGNAGLGMILGEGAMEGIPAAIKAPAAIRSAAIGDTNAAALRGLQIGPKSSAQLSKIRSIEGARPYVKGAESQADMQARLPGAMNETWGPYGDAINTVGHHPIAGPDGPTTVRELENERLRLSALNRGVKSGNPSDIQQAMQEGRTPAQLIEREAHVKSILDPYLEQTGIKPGLIRDTYGSLADVRNGVEGKTTLNEKPRPVGVGRIGNLSLDHPLKAPGELLGAGRDILAGRYGPSAKPTDLGIREGFAQGGPKPDLGRVTSTLEPPPPRGLLGRGAIPLGGSPESIGTPKGYQPPNFYRDTDAMRTGRLLNSPPIELGGSVSGPHGTPFHYDTTPQRLGRLLPPPTEGPIPLGGEVEGPKGPPFRYDSVPQRFGRILPPPTEDLPLSSHVNEFPNQRPGSTRIRPKTIEGKK